MASYVLELLFFVVKLGVCLVWLWYSIIQIIRFFLPFVVYKLSNETIQLEIGKYYLFHVLPRHVSVTIAIPTRKCLLNENKHYPLETSISVQFGDLSINKGTIVICIETMKLSNSYLLRDLLRSEPFEEKTLNSAIITRFFSIFAINVKKIDACLRLQDKDIISNVEISDFLLHRAQKTATDGSELQISISSLKSTFNLLNNLSQTEAVCFKGNSLEIAVCLSNSTQSIHDGEFLSRRIRIEANFDSSFKLRASLPTLLCLYQKYVECKDELLVEAGGEEWLPTISFRNQFMFRFSSLCVIARLGLSEEDPMIISNLNVFSVAANSGASSDRKSVV